MTFQPSTLLRFITAGSVDDGKSTLIGRLLYDSKSLLTDQLDKLNIENEDKDNIDFASMTDGLSAEREQGITIDVAYRYFSTAKRKFIIADTPGHEQYTRNMVTGASRADAAIILIDATRINYETNPVTMLEQTKRHSVILQLLGCKNIIIAINKLDLLNYDEDKYNKIIESYNLLKDKIKLTSSIYYIPMSALKGDNIVTKSNNTKWYKGLALLPLLETLPIYDEDIIKDKAHFPVQLVVRQDGSSKDDFRGYQGRLESGILEAGDEVIIQPSGKIANIKEIYSANQKKNVALKNEVITLTLDQDIDISRGDTILAIKNTTNKQQEFIANICWLDEISLNINRKYLIKHTTQITKIKFTEIIDVLDVLSLNHRTSSTEIHLNDIGTVAIKTLQPLTATSYKENHATGSFILIDEVTNHTVAAGMFIS